MAEDTGGPCAMRKEGEPAKVNGMQEAGGTAANDADVRGSSPAPAADEVDGLSSIMNSRDFWEKQNSQNGQSPPPLLQTELKPKRARNESENHKIGLMNDSSWLKQDDKIPTDADTEVTSGSPVHLLRQQFATSRECTNGSPVTNDVHKTGKRVARQSSLNNRINMFEKNNSCDTDQDVSQNATDGDRKSAESQECVSPVKCEPSSQSDSKLISEHGSHLESAVVADSVNECGDQSEKKLYVVGELRDTSVIDCKIELGNVGESSTDSDVVETNDELNSGIQSELSTAARRDSESDGVQSSSCLNETAASTSAENVPDGVTVSMSKPPRDGASVSDGTQPLEVTVDGSGTPTGDQRPTLEECPQCGLIIPNSSSQPSGSQPTCTCHPGESEPNQPSDKLTDLSVNHKLSDVNGHGSLEHTQKHSVIGEEYSRHSENEKSSHSVAEQVSSNTTWYCSLDESEICASTSVGQHDATSNSVTEEGKLLSSGSNDKSENKDVGVVSVKESQDHVQGDTSSTVNSPPDGMSDERETPDGASSPITHRGSKLAEPVIAAEVTQPQGQHEDESCHVVGQSLFYVDAKAEMIGQDAHVAHSCVSTAVADPCQQNKHHLVPLITQSSSQTESPAETAGAGTHSPTCTSSPVPSPITNQPPSPSSSQGNTQLTDEVNVEIDQTNSGRPSSCAAAECDKDTEQPPLEPVPWLESTDIVSSICSYAEQDILHILGSPQKRESTYVRNLSTFGKKAPAGEVEDSLQDRGQKDACRDELKDDIDDVLQLSLTLAEELRCNNRIKPLSLNILHQVVPVQEDQKDGQDGDVDPDSKGSMKDLYFVPEYRTISDITKACDDSLEPNEQTSDDHTQPSVAVDHDVTKKLSDVTADTKHPVRQGSDNVLEEIESDHSQKDQPSKRTGILKKVQKFFRSESPQDTSSDLDVSLDSINSSPVVLRKRSPNTPSPQLRRAKGSPSPKLRLKFSQGAPSVDSDGDSPRGSEDSDDDEDAGVYAESHRNSRWLYLGGSDLSSVPIDIDGGGDLSPNINRSRTSTESEHSGSLSGETLDTSSSGDLEAAFSSSSDMDMSREVNRSFDSGLSHPPPIRERQWSDAIEEYQKRSVKHCRSESVSTTVSEKEFRKRYHAKTTRIVQRKSSTHAYQRMSDRFYDEERVVLLEKDSADQSFGFHIKGSQPVRISTIEPGGISESSGLKVGDVIMSVNGINVLEASHQEVVKLMGEDSERLKLSVSADRMLMDEPLCEGYLVKQGGSGLLKNWRRRWFVLKPDHCLYYYKTHEDKDPLGAILLTNYTIAKAPEINRRFTFKAMKYSQRTYLFQADSENEMNTWANAMSQAAAITTKTDTWLDISSHNVGLPALSIKTPDCHGYLCKMGHRRKNWKRRYCVLKDACLYYYLDVMSSTAQGVAHLHGYEVIDSLAYRKPFGFTLTPPEPNMRTFYFYGDNDTDKKRWIDALVKSIGRWVRAEDHEC